MTDKKKRLRWIIGGTIFALGLSILLTVIGQPLAQADSNRHEERRLIGVFITTEPLMLPLNPSDLIDRWGRIDLSAAFQPGRIYAEWCEELQRFSFPELEGIPFFVPSDLDDVYSAHFGNGIRSHGLHLAFTDDCVSIDFEGTIYVTPRTQLVAYINHVFQLTDGRVFVEDGGSGFSVHGATSEGEVMSQTITEETNEYRISIKINHNVIFPPEKIVVLEMNTDSQLINRTDIDIFETEAVFHPQSETEYLIIELHRNIPPGMHGEPLKRELIAQNSIGIPLLYVREDGIIEKGVIYVEW